MRTKIVIGLLCVVALMAWTGIAGAQAAPTPKVQLPKGDTVWDLNGDWDALIENSGPNAAGGTYPNVYRITQTGSAFSAIRLKDTPPPFSGRAGTQSLLGELDKGGFKRVLNESDDAQPFGGEGSTGMPANRSTTDSATWPVGRPPYGPQ